MKSAYFFGFGKLGRRPSLNRFKMTSSQDCLVLTPDWIVPLESDSIRNGYLVMGNGKVITFGPELPPQFATAHRVALPGFAILPGLINAHCHLEFSDLDEPIPAGPSFPSWIRSLVERRSAQARDPDQERESRRRAIERGLNESYACGVRWIVDIATPPWESAWIETWKFKHRLITSNLSDVASVVCPLEVQSCMELMDIVPGRLQVQQALFELACSELSSVSARRVGLAPHAPYTTSISVTQSAIEISHAQSRLVSMHLAESRDEMQWLSQREGAFADLLNELVKPENIEEDRSVSMHSHKLLQAWRALVVHGNYLGEQELQELADRSDMSAIVHCPRTHRHFGHDHEDHNGYPIQDRIAKGIRHFIGTDSRASNPDLNLWTEVQFLKQAHPELLSGQILRMITLDAAAFLDIADIVGTLQTGHPTNLTAVRLADPVSDSSLLFDALLAPNTETMPLEMAVTQQSGITRTPAKMNGF